MACMEHFCLNCDHLVANNKASPPSRCPSCHQDDGPGMWASTFDESDPGVHEEDSDFQSRPDDYYRGWDHV